MRVIGVTGPTRIQPLKKEKAIEVGAEIIGEAFVYSVAASFIVFEYWKSSRKEASLESEQDKDIDLLMDKLQNVDGDIDSLKDKLQNVEKSLAIIGTKIKALGDSLTK